MHIVQQIHHAENSAVTNYLSEFAKLLLRFFGFPLFLFFSILISLTKAVWQANNSASSSLQSGT